MVLILVPPYLCSASWFFGVGIHWSSILPSIGICELKSVFPHWSCSCICHRKEKFASTLAGTQITWKAVSTWNWAQIFTVTLFKWLELFALALFKSHKCFMSLHCQLRSTQCALLLDGWVGNNSAPSRLWLSFGADKWLIKTQNDSKKISLE